MRNWFANPARLAFSRYTIHHIFYSPDGKPNAPRAGYLFLALIYVSISIDNSLLYFCCMNKYKIRCCKGHQAQLELCYISCLIPNQDLKYISLKKKKNKNMLIAAFLDTNSTIVFLSSANLWFVSRRIVLQLLTQVWQPCISQPAFAVNRAYFPYFPKHQTDKSIIYDFHNSSECLVWGSALTDWATTNKKGPILEVIYWQ